MSQRIFCTSFQFMCASTGIDFRDQNVLKWCISCSPQKLSFCIPFLDSFDDRLRKLILFRCMPPPQKRGQHRGRGGEIREAIASHKSIKTLSTTTVQDVVLPIGRYPPSDSPSLRKRSLHSVLLLHLSVLLRRYQERDKEGSSTTERSG